MNLASAYKKFCVRIAGGLAKKYMESFRVLEPQIRNANMKILLKTWVSITFATTILIFIVSEAITFTMLTFFVEIDPYFHVFTIVFFPVLMAGSTFSLFYVYPAQKSRTRKNSIENNMPFAITHMAAIASSGIPTEFMFDLLTNYKEYGEVSEESKIIMRNIKTFGMSSVDAIKNVGERTPSEDFRGLLLGIVSTVESGGNLIEYLDEMADAALFAYRIKREKYLKTLSTYADVYTALLVAAPLMMLSMLATMSIIGGSVMGLTIHELILLLTWVILPIVNISFLAFVHVTYPGV